MPSPPSLSLPRTQLCPCCPLTCASLTTPCLFPACAPGHFGADCRLQCQCQNGGTCDRFSGCVCPSGWHGVYCEKSGMNTRVSDPSRQANLHQTYLPVHALSPALRDLMVWKFSPASPHHPFRDGQQPKVGGRPEDALTSLRVREGFWEETRSEVGYERRERWLGKGHGPRLRYQDSGVKGTWGVVSGGHILGTLNGRPK